MTECPECDETVPEADLCCGKCVVKAIRRELRQPQTPTTGINAVIGALPDAEEPPPKHDHDECHRILRGAHAAIEKGNDLAEEVSTLQGQLRAANKHCEIAVDGRDKARKREDRYREALVYVRKNLAAPHHCDKGVACMECALVEAIDATLEGVG